MPYTEEQLRQVAVACFVNARDLYEDACLLGKHARYPRALVLAVIGAEEFVKSAAYTLAALNPAERARLSTFREALKRHDCKHLADDIIEGVRIVAKEAVDCEADLAGFSVAPGSYLRETLFELVRLGLHGLLRSKVEGEQHKRELNTITPVSAPSTAKERGLYVERQPEGLSTPSQLGEQAMRSALLALEWSLETFHDLPSLLEDDRHWDDLAKTIRQRLSRLPSY